MKSYRILYNGDKYKVQNTRGIWPFKWWVDLGSRKRTGVWELSLFNHLGTVRDCITDHKRSLDKKQWAIVAGGR